MIDILQYGFMRNALMAGVLASIACGMVGSFVVVKRMVFISGGISHSAFGGIGLGYLAGFNPVLGAIIFAILSALGIGVITERTRRQDTAIGILWAVGMASGVIFIGLSRGYAPDLFTYLFGNILTVPSSDIILMLVLDGIIITTILCFYKEFIAISFDEEYAKTTGIPVHLVNLILLCLIALTVVVLIRVVGIILVIALLTIPSATANQFVSDMRRLFWLSILLGVVFTISGLAISYTLNLPSGATIIILAGVIFAISSAVKSLISKRKSFDFAS
ncbi:MAG: metal ABC transporter permease [Candidatus Coatesbacteria bacterium]|nr:MAG: metal ABC transporter permease [Candidatus Coatesbacteria bacterium]